MQQAIMVVEDLPARNGKSICCYYLFSLMTAKFFPNILMKLGQFEV